MKFVLNPFTGLLDADDGGGGGANNILSNLSPTSINIDLTPYADNTINLGSNSKRFAIGYIHRLFDSAGAASIDTEARYLIDNSGNTTLNWSARQLFANDGSTVMLNWNTVGILDVNSNRIINTGNPLNPQDAATKSYVDTHASSASGPLGAVQLSDGSGGFTSSSDLNFDTTTKILTVSPAQNGTAMQVGNAAFISGFNGDGFLGAGATINSGSWVATQTSQASSYFSSGAGSFPGSYNIFTNTGLTPGIGFSPGLRFSVDGGGKVDIYTGVLDMHSNQINNVADPTSAQDVVTLNYFNANTPAAGANTTLSNLVATTSIPVSLIPTLDGSINIGSPTNRFLVGYIEVLADASNTTSIAVQSRQLKNTGNTVALDWHTAGILNASSNKISNVVDPTSAQDVVTLNYFNANTPAAGANASLSNLTTTLINQDLIPVSDSTINLGTNSKRFANGYIESLNDSATTQAISVQSRYLVDSSGNISERWDARRLIANDGSTIMIDWATPTNLKLNPAVTIGATSTTPTHSLNTASATPASGVGTLTNMPTGVSGNPTGYVTININGTNRVIPFW